MSYNRNHLLDLLAKAYAFDDESDHEKEQAFLAALGQVLVDESSANVARTISHKARVRGSPAQGIVVGGPDVSFRAVVNNNTYDVVIKAEITEGGLIVSGQLNGSSVADWEGGSVLLYMNDRLEDYTELSEDREFELTFPKPGTIMLRFLNRNNEMSIESEPFEVILK